MFIAFSWEKPVSPFGKNSLPVAASHLELDHLLLLLAEPLDAETHHVAGFQKLWLRPHAEPDARRRAVAMTPPGSFTMNSETYHTRWAAPKIIVRVLPV